MHETDTLKIKNGFGLNGFGMTMGAADGTLSREAADLFNSTYTFYIDLSLSVRKIKFLLSGYSGKTEISKPFVYDSFIFLSDKNAFITKTSFDAGYNILNDFRYTLTPFAGISSLNINYGDPTKDDEKNIKQIKGGAELDVGLKLLQYLLEKFPEIRITFSKI